MEILLLIISPLTESCKHLIFHSLIIICHSLCNMIWLTHWGRVTHICVVKLTIIGSDNGLSRQAIIWTNAGILLIGPLRTNFREIYVWNSNIFIQENALENVVGELASILSRPQCVNRMSNRRYIWYELLTRVSHKSCTCCFVVNNMMAVNAEATMTIWLRQVRLKHGNVSRITLPLCGESTGLQWIPLTNYE